jgi:LCCL domain
MSRIALLFAIVAFGLVTLALTEPGAAMQDTIPPCLQDGTSARGQTGWLQCTCSAEATQSGEVWGFQNYAEESSLCRAALHAGEIGPSGGLIIFEPRTGRAVYDGTIRNGVTSRSRAGSARSFGFSSRRIQARVNQGRQTRQAQRQPSPAVCPSDGRAFLIGHDAICQCSPAQIGRGAVYGVTHYSGDSSICRAAFHYGAVSRDGGIIHFETVRGRESYPAVLSNGVGSEVADGDSVAIVFASRRCPDTGEGLARPLLCSCNGAAVRRGEARGSGAYRSGSSICRAALFERKVDQGGGVVAVVPYSGTTTYNISRTVNGEIVSDSGTFQGGFEFRDLDDLD